MDRATRARQRRATWQAGVVTAADDALLEDVRFWQQATVEERLQAMQDLVREAWLLEHPEDGAVPRLDRSVCGVRRGRR